MFVHNLLILLVSNLLRKLKVHMVLHFVDCTEEFGPTSAFNTERYIYQYCEEVSANLFHVDLRLSTPIYGHKTSMEISVSKS